MKTFGWIIIVVVSVIIASISGVAFYVYKNQDEIIENIKFKFAVSSINFTSLLNPIVNIKTTIENNNPFFVIFSNLFVKLFYNGELIAQSETIDKRNHFLPIHGTTSFDHNMIINANIIKVKQPIKIDYEIDVRIFGFKINTIKDSFTL